MKYSREEMDVLADLVLDEFCKPGGARGVSAERVIADAVEGTGWTNAEFAAICDRRWNGPEWVR